MGDGQRHRAMMLAHRPMGGDNARRIMHRDRHSRTARRLDKAAECGRVAGNIKIMMKLRFARVGYPGKLRARKRGGCPPTRMDPREPGQEFPGKVETDR